MYTVEISSNLIKRIFTALLLAPLVIYGLNNPNNYSALGFLLFFTLAVFEWIRGFRPRNPNAPAWSAGTITVFVVGLAYILIAMVGFFSYFPPEHDKILLIALAIVVAGDVGAFVFGKFIGGPKLAPRISPNKTISGLIGGIITPLTCILLFSLYQQTVWLHVSEYLFFATISLVGHLGDLLESAWKRFVRIKDSGSILPGHGGVLDRADSFLAICFVLGLASLNKWFLG